MTHQQTFMTLPSLVRQAIERTTESAFHDVPNGAVISVYGADWNLIIQQLIELQDKANDCCGSTNLNP